MASKGFFLVLEGIDGSGKTTIARLLARTFKDALVTREPTLDSVPGKKIQAILRHEQAAPSPLAFQKLYIADRREHVANVIKPALAKGKLVICQRYVLSTLAYGTAFGVPRAKLAHRVITPDLTIFLDIPATLAMRRINARNQGKDYFEKKEKLEKIRKAYLKLAKPQGAVVIDGKPKPEVIAKQIWDILQTYGL